MKDSCTQLGKFRTVFDPLHVFWIPKYVTLKKHPWIWSQKKTALLSWPKLGCSWLGPLWPDHAPGILSHTAPLQLQAGSLRCRWNFPSPWETELQRGRASRPGTSSFCPARCDSAGSRVLPNQPTSIGKQPLLTVYDDLKNPMNKWVTRSSSKKKLQASSLESQQITILQRKQGNYSVQPSSCTTCNSSYNFLLNKAGRCLEHHYL